MADSGTGAETQPPRIEEYNGAEGMELQCSTIAAQAKKENEETKRPRDLQSTNAHDDGGIRQQRLLRILHAFYQQNEFLILVVTAIGLARLYPPLGAEYVYPHITATWIAIVFIFLLSGITLPTAEFVNVFGAWRFHLFVQIFSFGVDSVIIFGVSRVLVQLGVLSIELADGMTLCGSLPMTVNSAYVLTKCADGDEAAALFNSILGNMLGIFVSPLLLFLYIQVQGNIQVGDVLLKLALRVVLPTMIGQMLQKTMPGLLIFMDKYKTVVKRLHQFAMVFVVYTIFCRTFQGERDGKLSEIFLMILFQFLLLGCLMGLAWVALGNNCCCSFTPQQRVFGLFGCTHKTMAIGILLVDAMYPNDPKAGLYALPLLIYHPMQLVLGTMAVPHLAQYVQRETRTLPSESNSNDNPDDVGCNDTIISAVLRHESSC